MEMGNFPMIYGKSLMVHVMTLGDLGSLWMLMAMDLLI